MFVVIAVALARLPGSAPSNTYGRMPAAATPPPAPPDPQRSDCHATSVPSFFAASLIFAKAEGREPAVSSSMSRSSMILTGLPVFFASWADATSHWSGLNFDPNQPPTYLHTASTWPAG